MTPEELRKQAVAEFEAAKGVRAKAKAEERNLTPDEVTAAEEHLRKSDKLEADAKRIEDAEAATGALGSRIDQREAQLAAPQPSRVPLEDPKATAYTSGVRDLLADDPQGGFPTYGELCRVVHAASGPGARIDDRLIRLNAAQGQTTTVGEEGGFVVAPEYSNKLLERAMNILPVLGQCDRLTLGGNSITVIGMADHDRSGTTYRHGGVVVYWTDEADQITRSSLKFHKVDLKLAKITALSYSTEEELADSFINFGDRLLTKQATAIADELVEAIMYGNGVGRPQGAFASDACVSVAKETGQAADTVVFENAVKMSAALWSTSRAQANWYHNAECLPQLRTMYIAVGAGGVPVYLVGNSAVGGAPNTLDGRPIFETEHCEALGDAGDIVLGDFSQYLLATKGTIKTAMSIHLRFDYDETAFKSTFRVDGKPAWDTTLKPRKGASATRVSPFVKLAARA